MAGLVSTFTWALFISSMVMILTGAIAREINREGKLPPPGVDNEIRKEYEKESITRKPLVPDLMIIIGLILMFGMSTTLLREFDNARNEFSFYQIVNWTLAATGMGMIVIGHYLKRKSLHPSKTKPGSVGVDNPEALYNSNFNNTSVKFIF